MGEVATEEEAMVVDHTIPREVKEVDIMVMEEDMEVMLRRHGQCIICIKIIPCLFKSLRMEEEAMVVDHTIPREVKEVEQEDTEVEEEVPPNDPTYDYDTCSSS